MKRALITGVTGQDGSYLAELLLEKGYEVYGMIRRSSVDHRERIAHLEGTPHFHLKFGDLGDSISLVKLIGEVKPDEIYNLAAQSHVQVSFDVPEFTADIDATGVLRVLEAVRVCGLEKTCRIYQASTSELYGKVEEVPQKETTPFHPYSPYAVAKQYGYWIVKEYREAYDHLAPKTDGLLIQKTRYKIPFLEKYTIELDIFDGELAPLTLAEVEFESVDEANAFVPPEWFGEDVTYSTEYHNSTLSQKKPNRLA